MVLAGISLSGSKRANVKLGGFTYAFAEITDTMSSESENLQGRTSIPTGNLHHTRAKVKPKMTLIHAFFLNDKDQE